MLLYAGDPRSLSLALTIPPQGMRIDRSDGYRLRHLDVGAAHVAAGRGSVMWVSQIEAENPVASPWAVLTYEPGVGVRALAIEGRPRPEGGTWGANFSELVVGKGGRFQFTAGDTVYRAERYDSDVTITRLAGPGDVFVDPYGDEVIAVRVGSSLDGRSFAAGRTALTVYYDDPGAGSQEWMMLVDGTEPGGAGGRGGGCRVDGGTPTGGLGALLLVVATCCRRRTRTVGGSSMRAHAAAVTPGARS